MTPKKTEPTDAQSLAAARHFENPSRHRWIEFSRRLRQEGFRNAVTEHPAADSKLKRFVSAMAEHLGGEEVGKVGTHSVRKGKTRMTCDCKDWKFRCSHTGEDCKHIRQIAGG